MRRLLVCGMSVFVCVDVDVTISVVLMLVSVKIIFESETQRPDADAEQHDTHETFSPNRDPFHRDHIFDGKQQEADKKNSCRVAQAPTSAGSPRSARRSNRQRRDRSEMIRAGQNVDRTENQTGKRDDDDVLLVQSGRTLKQLQRDGKENISTQRTFDAHR